MCTVCTGHGAGDCWPCRLCLQGLSVCVGETSVVGVCSDPWECVCVCTCVCMRVQAGAWVTLCVGHAPLRGAECVQIVVSVYV